VVTLTRTKTTGPGKRVEVMEAVIALGAYFVDPLWLAVGLEYARTLWGAAPFMWPVPREGLEEAAPRPATYAEASACSLALADSLTLAGPDVFAEELQVPRPPTPLLAPGMGRFWTEHSERNFLASCAAATQQSKDLLNRLWRWKADCSDVYVRVSRELITRFQAGLARRIRLAEGDGDFLGERRLVEFEGYCRQLGYEEDVVEEVSRRLRHFGGGPAGDALWEDADGGPPPSSALAGSAAGEPGEDTSGSEGERVLPPGGLRDLHHGSAEVAQASPRGQVLAHPWGRLRRLLPARGRGAPPPSEYDTVCRQCWPGGVVPEAAAEDPATGSSSSESVDAEDT